MHTIISPDQFNEIPWKNGKGITTELAINEQGCIADFDWRLSIASVVEDGPFSDFSGYERALILIEGNGIALQHDNDTINRLDNILDIARFDGGDHTHARLNSGPIKDFNLMLRKGAYDAAVNTYRDHQSIALPPAELAFVYCLNSTASLLSSEQKLIEYIPPNHLLKLEQATPRDFTVRGEGMIVIALNKV